MGQNLELGGVVRSLCGGPPVGLRPLPGPDVKSHLQDVAGEDGEGHRSSEPVHQKGLHDPNLHSELITGSGWHQS